MSATGNEVVKLSQLKGTTDAIKSSINNVLQVAQGKTKTYVIANQSAITGTKASDGSYTNVTAITGITMTDLKIGDIILIVDTEVPDLWVSQITPSYTLSKLETTKVDLTGYVQTTRKVNNKALSSDITLTASDVNALPSNTSYVSSVNGSSGAITNIATTEDIPTATSELTNDSGFITNAYHDSTKQNAITSSNKLSASLVSGLSNVATSGSYNDLTNKPTIPSAVTESTVSGWGFTKNTGTVSSLSDLGITATATELNYVDGVTSNVQTQLNGKQATITSSNKLSTSLISGLSNVATSGSYNDLSNKPTIPSVSDATITINQGGTQKGTFTLNGSATTINLDAGGSIPSNIATYQGQSSGCVISWSGENTRPNWVLTTTDADAGNTNKYCSIANLKATMGLPTFTYDSSTYTLTITP